jgi:hypothetical protein
MDAIPKEIGADLFSAPDTSGSSVIAAPLSAEGNPGVVDDLDDLFGPSADPQDSALDDLFGSSAAIDPDKLFDATGTTGLQSAIPAGDLDGLFQSLQAEPPPPPPTAETKTLSGAPDEENPFAAAATVVAPSPTSDPPADDLFASSQEIGGDFFGVESSPSPPESNLFDPPPTASSPRLSANDLFGPEDEVDPEDATIDISMSSAAFAAPIPEPPPGGTRDLFEASGEASSEDLFGRTVPEIPGDNEGLIDLAPSQLGENDMRHLVEDQENESSPLVPGLEPGDLLAEAHLVADADGRSMEPPSSDPAAPAPHEDAIPPRPRAHQAKRVKPSFVTLPPDPGWPGKVAGWGGTLVASGILAMALAHNPRAATLSVPILAACLAILSGMLFVFTYAVAKIKLSAEFFSRVLTLSALAFAYTMVDPSSLSAHEPALGMLLCLLLGIGAVLWSHLLFLSLRVSLSIVGVYSCLSLLTGAAQGIPYLELVTRRVLQAPGLAAQLAPDRLALLLKAFDPLFLAVNFFLPVVFLLGVLEALYDLKKRWWGPALVRILQVLLTGAVIALNLRLYQQMKVPNLLPLLGLS